MGHATIDWIQLFDESQYLEQAAVKETLFSLCFPRVVVHDPRCFPFLLFERCVDPWSGVAVSMNKIMRFRKPCTLGIHDFEPATFKFMLVCILQAFTKQRTMNDFRVAVGIHVSLCHINIVFQTRINQLSNFFRRTVHLNQFVFLLDMMLFHGTFMDQSVIIKFAEEARIHCHLCFVARCRYMDCVYMDYV